MTVVGRYAGQSVNHLRGRIAGLYAVDALLSTVQIAALNASMFAGADPQRDVCRACPAGEVPGSGGACGVPVATGCPAGYAPSLVPPAVLARAIALVPGAGSPPRLASLAARAAAHTRVIADATLPTLSAAGGPGGSGAVVFDRAQEQYLDGGAQTFLVATNGGFTAVMVVMFTDTATLDYVMAFSDTSTNSVQVMRLNDGIRGFVRGDGGMCAVSSNVSTAQDTWMTIVLKYDNIAGTVTLQLDDAEYTKNCFGSTIEDYGTDVITESHIGRGVTGSTVVSYFAGEIAGLFAVDALLDKAQTTSLAAQMRAGEDPLVPSCAACAPGEFNTLPGDEACDVCAAGTASLAAAATAECAACPPGQIQTQAGQAACVDCPADTFRETDSSASLQTDCTPCPDFSTSDPGTTLETDCLCNAGYS